jgi:hypothetical protein
MDEQTIWLVVLTINLLRPSAASSLYFLLLNHVPYVVFGRL